MTERVGNGVLVHDHVHGDPAGLEGRGGKLIDLGHDARVVPSQLTAATEQLDEHAHVLAGSPEHVLQGQEAHGGEALFQGNRLRERVSNPGFYDPYVEPVLDRGQALLEQLRADAAPPIVRMYGQASEFAHQVRVGAYFKNDRGGSDDSVVLGVIRDEHERLVGEDQLLDLEFIVVLRVGVVPPVRGQVDLYDPLYVRVLRLPDRDHRAPPSSASAASPVARAHPPRTATSANHAAPEARTSSSISNRLEWAG